MIHDMEGCHNEAKQWATGGRAATAKKQDINHREEFWTGWGGRKKKK